MKRLNKGSILFTGLLLLFALFVCASSFKFVPKVRLVPLLVGVPTFIIALLVLINEIHPVRLLSRMELDLMGIKEKLVSEGPAKDKSAYQLLIIAAWMIGFWMTILLFGFYVGIAAFVFTFLTFQAKVGWHKAFFIAGVVTLFIFGLFSFAMELHMFQGVLFDEILPSI